jgi:hypothetical protein
LAGEEPIAVATRSTAIATAAIAAPTHDNAQTFLPHAEYIIQIGDLCALRAAIVAIARIRLAPFRFAVVFVLGAVAAAPGAISTCHRFSSYALSC